MQGQTIKFKNFIAGLWGRFQKKAFLAFWVIFIIILAFEMFVIKDALGMILKPAGEPLAVKKRQGIRLDFQGYNKVIEIMNKAKNFKAEIKVVDNPFEVK